MQGRHFASGLLALMLMLAYGTVRAESFDFVGDVFESLATAARNQSVRQVMVRATLEFPPNRPQPVPAVVIAHASGGLTIDVEVVARAMRNAGFATVHYDSYVARGIGSTTGGGAPVSVLFQARDAYQALKRLAADTRIDPRRVAMVGMSVGGGATIAAAAESVRRSALGVEAPRFAAHIAFYPGLHAAPDPAFLTGAPLLILPGADDDYMSPHRVNGWVKHVRDTRPTYPVEVVVVPNGLHSYLAEGLASRYVPEYVNASLCPLFLLNPLERKLLAVDGTITSDARCQPTRGARIGYHSGASAFALQKAIDFLTQSFAAVK